MRKNKVVKWVVIVVAILLVLVVIAGFIVGNFFYSLALDPTSDKSAVLGTGQNTLPTGNEEAIARRKENNEWFDNVGHYEVDQTSYDGLKLKAFMVDAQAETNKWAITVHGYTGQPKELVGRARHFYDLGYNLLMPNARGHGTSEGDYIGMGWDDRLDIIGWIDQIVEKNPNAEIVLYGVSMGGATVMMVSGETLPPNVKVIVEDCGYTSAWAEFSHQIKGLFGLPAFPILNFSSLVTKIRAGYMLEDASAIKQVAKSVTPMFFVHGTADTFVPFYMMQQVYDAANVEKEMLAIEGAGHGQAADKGGELYWEKVDAFVARFITE